MNTLLYIGQIAIGAVVVAAGLAGSAKGERPSTSVGSYADIQVGGINGLIGVLLGVATLVLGVVGLAGSPVAPAPVAILIAMSALVSVVLAIETSSPVHEIETEGHAVARGPRSSAETGAVAGAGAGAVVALPGRDRTPEAAGSVSHAA